MSEVIRRVWDGEMPPRDLHEPAVIKGALIKPWAVPVLVENPPLSPERVVVAAQGLGGTTPKERPTGESGRIAPEGSTTIIDMQGEPMAGDPVSKDLRRARS